MSTQRGFTLLEMAIVLVIVGLLLGGLFGSLGAMQGRQRTDQTARQLAEIREALVGFAAANGRLPCPANPATPNTTAGAGIERTPNAAGCVGGVAGVVPWATLGLSETDAWGRRYSYRVAPAFARNGTPLTLATVGNLNVRNRSAVVLASQVPAVVVSHGANAFGSYGPSGAVAGAGTNAFEIENGDADVDFVDDTPTTAYDDQVMWLSSTVLAGRLLQAGVLP